MNFNELMKRKSVARINLIYDEEEPNIFQNPIIGLDMWWFFDEAYHDHGPYDSREEAKTELHRYYHFLNTGEVI